MNNQQFLQEVHSYIDKTYKEFEEYQEIVKDILQEFSRVCKKNDIPFWLAYGNMIGAVRDHSQLPWDYDVDVLTPVDDRIRLIRALDVDLSEDYSYAYWTNTKNYPTICLRVYYKKYAWMALHVDVFFLMGAPTEEEEQLRFINRVGKLWNMREKKYILYHLPLPNRIKQFVYHTAIKLRYLFITDGVLNKRENDILYRYPMKSSKFYMPFGGIKLAIFPKEVFETEMVEVNGASYPVPSGYDLFLTKVYGDWHKYLSINRLFDEFYTMKKIVDERK